MLFILIKNWDRKWLVSYGDYSQKSSIALGVSGITNLPREEVYQIETVSNLRTWLPKSYNIYTQVTVKKDGKRKDMSADILIEKGEEKILFELVAHTNRSDVEEHINRAKEYADALDATSTYFTTSPKILEYPFCSDNDQVQVLHIQHSPEFDIIKLYQHKEHEPISIL